MDAEDQQSRGAWCVIHTDDLLRLMHRAHDGEEPGDLLLEWYVEADTHEHYGGMSPVRVLLADVVDAFRHFVRQVTGRNRPPR